MTHLDEAASDPLWIGPSRTHRRLDQYERLLRVIGPDRGVELEVAQHSEVSPDLARCLVLDGCAEAIASCEAKKGSDDFVSQASPLQLVASSSGLRASGGARARTERIPTTMPSHASQCTKPPGPGALRV
jgi:hypothetical protein